MNNMRYMKLHQKTGRDNSYCTPNIHFQAFAYSDYERQNDSWQTSSSHKGKRDKGYGINERALNKTTVLQAQFNLLASKWKRETGLYSTSLQKVNDTYLEIIGKGKDMLPLILQDLSEGGPFHWHIALKAITGTDPVTEHNKPILVKNAWINWGKENRII